MEQLSPEFLVQGLIWYVVFLFSTTCHEASHSLAAKLGGDPTAFHGGQVTLNPIPHIRRETFGMVWAPILSYVLTGGGMIGWASAPYDPKWQERFPHRAALMSLAGPAANFLLFAIAAIAIRVGLSTGVFQPATSGFLVIVADPQTVGGLAAFGAMFLSVLFFENLLLGTFNLLPVPPMDGSTGIAILMTKSMALRFLRFTHNPTFRMVGLLAAWVMFGQIFAPIFRVAVSALYAGY